MIDNGHQIILYGQMYTNYQTEINGTNTFVNPKPNSVYSEGTEVIVPASGETSEDISIASAITSNNIIIGGDLNIILPKNFINNTFLALTMSYGNSKKKLSKFAQGKTIVHLHGTNFRKLSIYLPIFDEQIKIKKLITNIEKNINLHRRKINILEKMKQEYLKLLFVAYKKSLPKIRFAEFNDKWESNKLENYMSERTERSAKGELISVTIDSGVVKANSLQRKDNSSKDKSNYKIVRKGDIPYNSMRMWQGASGLSPHNGILSPAYTVLTPKANTSGAFFIYLFKTELLLYEFKKYSQGLTSDTWNLKYPLLKTINVQIPGIHEQRAIGEFLTKFDEVILIHNKKVNRLLKMKQVYLKKMFI